jgi:predicted nucleic acid-binding protein
LTLIVLDANILIRAVLGSRVFVLLGKYTEQVKFLAPDTAFEEAKEHVPRILQRREISVSHGAHMLSSLINLVQAVEPETYQQFESPARKRIKVREEDDWPILASALALNCPIWTEGVDFFAVEWRHGPLIE